MTIFKGILIFLGIIVFTLLLNWGFGWFDVFNTRTVGKAKEDARREVFENTQSYVEGKRQEATKLRLEYMRSSDELEKKAIKSAVALSFANFDEDKLPTVLRDFVYDMKYGAEEFKLPKVE
jgi:hypothetical protein